MLLVVVDVPLELGVVELESETLGRGFSGVELIIRFCVGINGVVSPEDGVGGANRLGPGSSLINNVKECYKEFFFKLLE